MENQTHLLAVIVGEDGVSDAAEDLEAYAKDRSCAPRIPPRFVARPRDSSQVQALVNWANRAAVPLIPVSSGPPHSNGDTVPSVAEAVIVDLSRINAIRKIDRRNRIAIIEPGVTYAQLEPALAEQGLRIPRPLLPRANKSVIASLLERQPTTIPRLNYSLPEPLRVCGVVWGTGDVSFTGEAGMGPLSLEAQWSAGLAQVNQQGPLSTDLMRLLTGAQGTMGIVVWASIKCQLLPAARKRFTASAPRIEDLIEFCRKIERLKLGDEVSILNSVRLGAAMSRPAEELPPWTVLLGASGTALYPEEKLNLQEKELGEAAAEYGLKLEPAGAETAALLDGFAEPAPQREIFFLSTLDDAPKYIETMFGLGRDVGYGAGRIGVYIQPQHQGVSQHVEFTIPYDAANRQEAVATKRLFLKASEELIAQGAYFSRPYGPWADLVYSRDATASRVLRTVKQIVDPNGVMNPGKLCF
jgi:FAD/FMN-containing dehydrogenase